MPNQSNASIKGLDSPKRASKKIEINHLKLVPIEPNFIPYSCHYNNTTILTKDGELMQTIKITGFKSEDIQKQNINITDLIKKAITISIKTSNFAICTHTVRRKQDITTNSNFNNPFSNYLNKRWNQIHHWDNKYVNELYITILTETNSYNNFKDIAFSILPSYVKNKSFKHLKKSFQNLDSTVNKMLSVLKKYGAHKLSIYKKNNVYYSELITFLNKIINLNNNERKFTEQDLSEYIPESKIAIGNNIIELDNNNQKHFATIFTIKEYNILSTNVINNFLALPIEFVITQSIDFIQADEIFKTFEYQRYILAVSESKEFARLSGIEQIVYKENYTPASYGTNQLTLMLIADDVMSLNNNAILAGKKLASYGIATIREDMLLGQCFWAQLPGNFQYVQRKSPIDIDRFGGFASLNNYPAGQARNNHWGDCVTIFYTEAKTPYFFNFHVREKGHTLVIGPFRTGKSVTVNFLVAMSRKFNGKLFFFDHYLTSEILIRSLGGKYSILSNSKKELNLENYRSHQFLKLNPLQLDDTPENRKFLHKWLGYLIISKEDIQEETYVLSENKKTSLTQIVNYLFDYVEKPKRKLENLQPIFQKLGLEKTFHHWYGDGAFANFFNNDIDEFDDSQKIWGFDITYIEKHQAILIPTISYLLYKMELLLDGSPTVIVLDEAWKILDNIFFADDIENFLNRVQQKNAIVILASESIEDVSNSKITDNIIKNIQTQIYLPNTEASDSYKTIFKLNDNEFNKLSQIKTADRQFLLKQNDKAVIAQLNLSRLPDIIDILSAKHENINIMNAIINDVHNDNPNYWFKEFIDKLYETHNYPLESFDIDIVKTSQNIDFDDYQNMAQQYHQKILQQSINEVKNSELYSTYNREQVSDITHPITNAKNKPQPATQTSDINSKETIETEQTVEVKPAIKDEPSTQTNQSSSSSNTHKQMDKKLQNIMEDIKDVDLFGDFNKDNNNINMDVKLDKSTLSSQTDVTTNSTQETTSESDNNTENTA